MWKITPYYHQLIVGGGGGGGGLRGCCPGGGEEVGLIVCCPNHRHTLILLLYLGPLPSPPPLWIYQYFFFQQQFPKKRASEMKGNSNVVFCFHFWHLISNLNGYQEQISAYSPDSSHRVQMQMCHICYIEWRCLILKEAYSLCVKSFSPANDKGTKWKTTPQAWVGFMYECYHTDWINFSCNKSHFKATEILKKFNQI